MDKFSDVQADLAPDPARKKELEGDGEGLVDERLPAREDGRGRSGCAGQATILGRPEEGKHAPTG